MKWLYDNAVLVYCFVLACMGCFFLGVEITTIRHDAEIRQANNQVMNCQKLISRSIYE